MKTAESVSLKHPDKICDQISDAILDACLGQDPMSRCAIECMGGHGIITITGELTTKAYINIREIAQRIAGTQYGVQVNIVQQSPNIAQGVDNGGAGDQGISIGYACRDNEEMIPQESYLARSLCKFIYNLHPFDGKTQITINDDGVIQAIVASFQNTTKEELEYHIGEWLKINLFPRTDRLVIHANAAGDWNIGGFEADTGLTGRKLMVDNYGPQVAIGGGCFSGKDATKVDRSAAYMARKIAVDLLKLNNAKEVIVKLAYVIGVAEPVMAIARVDGEEINVLGYDLMPKGIIDFLDLRKPIYEETAKWGHFGHSDLFTWES